MKAIESLTIEQKRKLIEKIEKNQRKKENRIELFRSIWGAIVELKDKIANIKDGYTPQKGIDYHDGKDGEKGEKGDKGDSPTHKELIELIGPLIPKPIAGKDGNAPTEAEILKLIKPLIPKSKLPSDKKLLELIAPLVPKVKNGKDGKDGSPDTPIQIRDKLQSLPKGQRLNAKYIDDIEKFAKNIVGSFTSGVRNFLGLDDTPNSYGGYGGKIVKVKTDESGLEFADSNPGDITSVVAGTGLAGGGASGDVTVSLDTVYTDAHYATIDFDTQANILGSTPVALTFGLASDTNNLGIYSSGTWYNSPFSLVAESPNPDVGAIQTASRIGYGTDYITHKRISNVLVGSNNRDEEGAIRISDGVYQIYLNGQWNDVTINFRFRSTSAESYQLEFNPTGFTDYYDVLSGNGDTLGANGQPLTQNYYTVAGANGTYLVIDGGTF